MNIILLSNLDANIEIILHVYNIIRKLHPLLVYSIFYIYILTMDGEIIMRPIILKRITTEIKHN